MSDPKRDFARHLTEVYGRWIPIAAACRELGVSTRTLDRAIKDGNLRAYRIAGGRSYRASVPDVVALLEEL